MLGMTVPVTPEDGSTQHTYGIDIRMMHLSAKDFFNVWDFAGQVHTYILTSIETLSLSTVVLSII